MHTNHCLSSDKAIPIQEVQNLLWVDAAASDAENFCMWCLASPIDIFGDILFQHLWNNSARLNRLTKQRFNNKQTVEKEFFIHIIEICCNWGMLVKSYRYWLSNWQPLGGNLLSDSLPSKVIRFRALVSFTYSQYTPVRGNDVMAKGTRHQQKLQKFVKEFNFWY